MTLEFTGRLTWLSEIESGTSKTTGNPWQKRSAAIIEDSQSQWPDGVVVTAMNDKVALFDQFPIGTLVTVKCDPSAREWQGHNKWFMDLRLWAIKMADQQTPQGAAQPVPAQYQQQAQQYHQQQRQAQQQAQMVMQSAPAAPQPQQANIDFNQQQNDDLPF